MARPIIAVPALEAVPAVTALQEVDMIPVPVLLRSHGMQRRVTPPRRRVLLPERLISIPSGKRLKKAGS